MIYCSVNFDKFLLPRSYLFVQFYFRCYTKASWRKKFRTAYAYLAYNYRLYFIMEENLSIISFMPHYISIQDQRNVNLFVLSCLLSVLLFFLVLLMTSCKESDFTIVCLVFEYKWWIKTVPQRHVHWSAQSDKSSLRYSS